MTIRDIYQEKQEIETLIMLEKNLAHIFEQLDNDIYVLEDNYYEDKPNPLYQLLLKGHVLGVLGELCEQYNINYTFHDYIHNKETHRFENSRFIFRKKELAKSNSHYYLRYLHK